MLLWPRKYNKVQPEMNQIFVPKIVHTVDAKINIQTEIEHDLIDFNSVDPVMSIPLDVTSEQEIGHVCTSHDSHDDNVDHIYITYPSMWCCDDVSIKSIFIRSSGSSLSLTKTSIISSQPFVVDRIGDRLRLWDAVYDEARVLCRDGSSTVKMWYIAGYEIGTKYKVDKKIDITNMKCNLSISELDIQGDDSIINIDVDAFDPLVDIVKVKCRGTSSLTLPSNINYEMDTRLTRVIRYVPSKIGYILQS